MGNIRPTYIKRVALDLVERFPEEFTQDYEHNKQKVKELTDVSTTTMRNRIAGYITTVKNKTEEN